MGHNDRTDAELRAELDRLLELRAADERTVAEADERGRLLRELQLHQVELEAQNRELREAQSALEASRNRYADLYDFAPIAYITLSERGAIEEVNRAAAELLGKEREHLIGRPFVAVARFSDVSAFFNHLRLCTELRAPVTTELTFSTRASGPRVFHVASAPARDALGAMVGLHTSFTDITARKEMVAELERAREGELRARRRFEALDAAMLALTKALARLADPTEVLQIVVDEARRLSGAEFAAIGVGTDPAVPFSPWVESGTDAAMTAAIGRPARPVGLLGEVARTGRSICVGDIRTHPGYAGLPAHHPEIRSFLGVPIFFGGRPTGNLYLANKRSGAGFTRDDVHVVEALAQRIVSPALESGFSDDDRRAAEMLAERAGTAMEIARLSDALHAALRAREDLLAVVAHDLGNPLWAIRVHAQTLREAVAGDGGAGAVKAAEAISRAVELMDGLINDLLQAAEIEAGTFKVEPAREDVAPLFEDLLLSAGPIAASKSVRVEPSLPADVPAIRCDRKRVMQVLSNLVGNAIKFAAGGGAIRVEAAAAEREVRFTVTDSGPGIAEDELPHIFDRYWKGNGQQPRGVGLGLFIAKGIVEAHGGRIWATSERGVGSSFHFALPTDSPR